MRKSLFALLILLAPALAAGQNTNVSFTMVDTDGTHWFGGTWKMDFHPNPNQPGEGNYRLINGQPLSGAVLHQNGTTDTTGFASIVVYDSTLVTPTGSGWTLTLCPNASAPCGVYQFSSAGGSMDLSSNLTSRMPVPRFEATGNKAFGYTDTEAMLKIATGGCYWNVTTNNQRCWNGTQFVNAAGNPGGGAQGNPNEIQINNNGSLAAGTGVTYTSPGGLNATGPISAQQVGGSCYAKAYQNPSGTGNNGIHNAMSSCVAVISDPTYSLTESIDHTHYYGTAIGSPSLLLDQRGGYTTELYRNPATDPTGKPTGVDRLGFNTMTGKVTQCNYDLPPVGSPNGGYVFNFCTYISQVGLTPGWGWGGWTLQVPLSIQHMTASAGTQESIYINQHVNALGDNVGIYNYAYAQGGEVQGSAEGTKAMAWTTSEEANAFAGSVTHGPTSLNPTSITTSPRGDILPWNYLYGLGAGRYAVPIGACSNYPTACPAAPYTGTITSLSQGLDGHGSSLAVTPSTGTFTQSVAYGKLNADAQGSSLQPPLFSSSVTLQVTIEGGVNGAASVFDGTHLICLDSTFHDCAYPSSTPAPPSGGVQTITLPLRRFHNHVDIRDNQPTHVWQGGMAGTCIFPTAYANSINNTNQPLRYCYDVFGSYILTGTLTSVTASAGNGTTTYSGTFPTGFCLASNSTQVTFSGFTNPTNNGSFICYASTATAVYVFNPAAVAETASATATIQVLQAGRFGYSALATVDTLPFSLYGNLSPGITSSGTIVTANWDSGGWKPGNGAAVSISQAGGGIDGTCLNVTYTNTTTFTCANPALTGTHSSTYPAPQVRPLAIGCAGCSTTWSINSWSLTSGNLASFVGPNPPFHVGDQVFLSGFTGTGSFWNNVVITLNSVVTGGGGYIQATYTGGTPGSAYLNPVATGGIYNAAQLLGAYSIYPAAEVLDVRNSYTATQFSITGNVLTVTANPNNLAVGATVLLNGFTSTAGAALNNQIVTVVSATATQFTAAFTSANVALTQDIGAVTVQAPQIDGTLTLEPNVFPALANGSYVEEIHHIMAQFQGHTENNIVYNSFTTGLHDIYALNAGGAGISGGAYSGAAQHLLRVRNTNPDNMYFADGGTLGPPGVNYFNGPYYSWAYLDHMPDGGHLLYAQSAPYQANSSNYSAGIVGLLGRNGYLNWSYTPYSGDMNMSTNGNAVYGVGSGGRHHFNGPVDIANDAGLISAMSINYVPNSNNLTVNATWGNTNPPPAGNSVTCNTTNDLGDPACTITNTTTSGWNISDIAGGSYTALTVGQPYTIQARMKGALGTEYVDLTAALVGAQGHTYLTTNWANYCVSFTPRSGFQTWVVQLNLPSNLPQTIYVSNFVVRPGTMCGPPALTTNNQILTPTPINRFPGAAMVIAKGTVALPTGTIAQGACYANTTATASGVLSTDTLNWAFANAPDPSWGEMTIHQYVITGSVGWQICNPPGTGSANPVAANINWTVTR